MSNMELPWYKEYATNEIAQLIDLNEVEMGVYYKLKLVYWSSRDVGISIDMLDRLANEDNNLVYKYIIERFFTQVDGAYHHKGLLEQIEKYKENSLKQKIKLTEKSPLGDLKVTSSHLLSSSSSSSSSTSNIINIKKVKSENFDKFWTQVKRKVSKGQCQKAYNKLPEEWSTQPDKLAELYNAHYDLATDKQYTKHPATWLNAESYLDVINKAVNDDLTEDQQDERDKSDWEFAKRMGRWLPAFSAERIRRCEEKYGKINS